ncbi:kelch repeat-containing protein At3g27220-like [Primulina huaijiensis]|uniref:kelch repeat-containing protein At3g27220-like n=1 Tax=Primulina huaijiensis TaxID=1492673 RepID=UPI003CC743EF
MNDFRYAPATQIWRGRLHVIGGSKENHYTPGVDHWSLLVKNGKAVEKQWQKEYLDTLQWSIIGKLPYRIKTTLAGFWNGWLYFTSGQRDRGPDNPQPRKVGEQNCVVICSFLFPPQYSNISQAVGFYVGSVGRSDEICQTIVVLFTHYYYC